MYDVLHHQTQGSTMRTTLAIDDDIIAAAKHLAAREQKTIGEIVSSLARQGLARGEPTKKIKHTKRNGVPLLPYRADAVPITLELVNQLRDE